MKMKLLSLISGPRSECNMEMVVAVEVQVNEIEIDHLESFDVNI